MTFIKTLALCALALPLMGSDCNGGGGDPLPEEQVEHCSFGRYGDLTARRGDGTYGGDNASVTPAAGGGAQLVLRYQAIEPREGRCWWVTVHANDSEGAREVLHDGPVALSTSSEVALPVELAASPQALDETERFFTVTLHDGLHVEVGSAYIHMRAVAPADALPQPPALPTCDDWSIGERAMSIGLADAAGEFRPFGSDHPAELLWGFQGASMVVPRVRVASDGGSADECAHVLLANVHADGQRDGGESGIFRLVRQPDGALLSGHFFDEIGARAVGTTVSIEVTVTGDGWRTHERFAVPVVDNE